MSAVVPSAVAQPCTATALFPGVVTEQVAAPFPLADVGSGPSDAQIWPV